MKEKTDILFLKKKLNERNDLLKIIAIIAMVIDHVGIVFFPQFVFFRIIGRLAMPVFALGIADGYRHTSSLKNYLLKILAVGIVSQIPYALLLNVVELNILFLFILSLAAIYLVDKKLYLGLIPLFAMPFIFPIDYGWYGMAMILFFYIFKDKKILLIFFSAVLVAAQILLKESYVVAFQMLGIFLAVYFPGNFYKLAMPKIFFYWFYPLHLIALLIIKLIIL